MRRSPSTPWCLQQSTQPFITKRGVSVDVGMCLHAPCSLPLVLVSEVDQYLPGLKGPGLTGSGRRRGGASLPAKERGRGCLAHSQGGEAWHWSRAGLGSWPTGGRRAATAVGQALPTRLWPATPMKPRPSCHSGNSSATPPARVEGLSVEVVPATGRLQRPHSRLNPRTIVSRTRHMTGARITDPLPRVQGAVPELDTSPDRYPFAYTDCPIACHRKEVQLWRPAMLSVFSERLRQASS